MIPSFSMTRHGLRVNGHRMSTRSIFISFLLLLWGSFSGQQSKMKSGPLVFSFSPHPSCFPSFLVDLCHGGKNSGFAQFRLCQKKEKKNKNNNNNKKQFRICKKNDVLFLHSNALKQPCVLGLSALPYFFHKGAKRLIKK